MGMKQDLKDPREGGLSAKEFEKEHGISKSKVKKISPRTTKGMKRGGYVKAGASYKG